MNRTAKIISGIICSVIGILCFSGISAVHKNIPLYICFCLAFIVGGILIIYRALKHEDSTPIAPQNKPVTTIEPKQVQREPFPFPERDENGRRLLKLYTVTITGSTRSHNGVDAQDTIRALQIGDQMLLCAQPDNEYDSKAVMVTDMDGRYAGWLPANTDHFQEWALKEDVFDRLMHGLTVYARVSKIASMRYKSECQYCTIEIARYERPRTKKTEN